MSAQTATSSPALEALAALNLSAEQMAALKRGGAVLRKPRGRRGFVFLLRFTLNGKQRAVYVGTDPVRAKNIQAVLEVVQRPRKLLQRLRKRIRQTGQLLASGKPQLEPYLRARFYHFHGRAIRRLSQPAAVTLAEAAAEAAAAQG